MSKNKQEVVVALDGEIYAAPASTTLPEDLSTLDPGFVDLGYASEDGVTFTVTPEVTDVNAWQSSTPIRRIVTSRALTLAFSAQQWNVNTFAAAYGGGEWSEDSPGVYRYDPPADADDLASYAVVLDFKDGNKNYRLVVMEANVTEATESNLTRGGAALLPITFSAITPDNEDRSWYLLSDDPALEPSS